MRLAGTRHAEDAHAGVLTALASLLVDPCASAATAGKVIPFTRGQPSPATKVGQVPANFNPGTGKIVTGTAASKAKAAALAAYPGGTVTVSCC